MTDKRIKLGVLGAGHLGKIHIKLAKELNEIYDLVGFYDPDPDKRDFAQKTFGIKPYSDIESLVNDSDAIDIVSPTLSHFESAMLALRNSKHVFIEKPITNTLDEARKLVDLTHEAKVKVQVGHVERFNPAFQSVASHFDNVMFIETHRLAEFNPRGTDVSVVLDLMIHDIDITLNVVKANLRKISSSGVAVISDTPDICNARLEFDNGSVANLTSSRISLKNMRKSRFFQRNAYITVDFMERKSEVVRIREVDQDDPYAIIINPGEGKDPKQIYFDHPEVKEQNAIQEELKTFAESILNDQKTKVTVEDGYNAIQVAHQILEQLNFSNSIFAAQ